jgi:Glycosyl hydrolases family 16
MPTVEPYGWGSGQLQVYTASNVDIVNGEHLQIVVSQENYGFGTTEDDADGTLYSARLDTKDKVHMLYGTLSVRLKLVHSSATVVGMNPSIWTMSAKDDDDDVGQVFVANVGPGVSAASMQPRVVSSATWSSTTNANTTMTASGWLGCEQDNHDWAIYTLDWTPDSIATYRNNDLVFFMPIDEASCGDCRLFHEPQYIGLNVAVGGGFASPPYGDASRLQCAINGNYNDCGTLLTATDIDLPSSTLMAVLQVDWIRIFDNGHCQVIVTPPSSPITTTAPAPAAAAPATPVVVVNENGVPSPPVVVPTLSAPVIVSTPLMEATAAPAVLFPVALATTEPAPTLSLPPLAMPVAVSVPTPIRDSVPVRPSVRQICAKSTKQCRAC